MWKLLVILVVIKLYGWINLFRNTLWGRCFITSNSLQQCLVILGSLVETKSDLIVRSVETDLGRWTLVVFVIVLMLVLFQLFQTWLFVLRIQEEVFFSCPVLPDQMETELGSSKHEVSPSTSKSIGVVLAPCRCCKCVPIQLFTVMWIIPRSLSVIWYNRWVLSKDLQIYFKDWCLLNSQSNFLFLNYF